MILLLASGEAGRRDAARLAAHLSICAECRAYQESTGRVERAARTGAQAQQPSPDVVSRILAQAREAAERDGGVILWRPLLRQALGLAASLAVIAGVWFYYSEPAADAGISEARALVALVSDEHAVLSERTHATEHTDGALRTLGAKLLEWEGFAEDDVVADGAALDDVIERQVPSPTILQSHSIDASAAEICV